MTHGRAAFGVPYSGDLHSRKGALFADPCAARRGLAGHEPSECPCGDHHRSGPSLAYARDAAFPGQLRRGLRGDRPAGRPLRRRSPCQARSRHEARAHHAHRTGPPGQPGYHQRLRLSVPQQPDPDLPHSPRPGPALGQVRLLAQAPDYPRVHAYPPPRDHRRHLGMGEPPPGTRPLPQPHGSQLPHRGPRRSYGDGVHHRRPRPRGRLRYDPPLSCPRRPARRHRPSRSPLSGWRSR
ncbi:hypothetical protein D3C87_1018840 [compost metagenome]